MPQSVPARCPVPSCGAEERDGLPFFRRKGVYRRKDAAVIARFQCRACRRHFSAQTLARDRGWKVRGLVEPALRLHSRGLSCRAAARLLGVDRRTYERRVTARR
jgi:transposase-like protein